MKSYRNVTKDDRYYKTFARVVVVGSGVDVGMVERAGVTVIGGNGISVDVEVDVDK